MSSETSASLAELTTLVGTLGSSEHAAWWNCSFLSPTGIETLKFNFPRAAISAAVAATSKAASIKHDQAAGAVGVFHLFRLPPGMAEKVHRQFVGDNAELAQIIASRDLCIDRLQQLAGDESAGGLGPGARDLGKFESDDKTIVSCLAASYFRAFEAHYETFPYFTLP